MTQVASDIIRDMGRVLLGNAPKEATRVAFRGYFFESSEGFRIDYFDAMDDRIGPNGLKENPKQALRELAEHARKMQRLPLYQPEPFSHFLLELANGKDLNLKLKYIPEWDSWSGLFLRGVTDLTDAECDEHGIPLDDAKLLRMRRVAEPYTS